MQTAINPIQFVQASTNKDDYNIVILGNVVGTFQWKRNVGGNPSTTTAVVRVPHGPIGIVSDPNEAINMVLKMYDRLDEKPEWFHQFTRMLNEQASNK